MKYKKLIEKIVENIGGLNNIESVYHCMTRLRFKLKNDELVKVEKIKKIEGVLSLIHTNDQYQVVIGTHVDQVYKELEALMLASDSSKSEEEQLCEKTKQSVKKKKISSSFLDLISGVFTPVLGILTATGVIKGLLVLLTAGKLLDSSSGTYLLLDTTANCFFYAMPVFLGYTSMKKFGGTPFIGMGIGFALIYPNILTTMKGEVLYTLFSGTMFESPVFAEFLGIPIILMNYSSSVIPIIVTSYLAAKVEQFFEKYTPEIIKSFFVAMMTLLISIPAAFMIVGPISMWASNILGEIALALHSLNPIVYGFLYGALIQVFVMFGLHWGFIAICLNNMATLGYDPIAIAGLASPLAQAGVVLMIWLMTKNKEKKALASAALFPAFLGITEPAIYGVTLHNKKAFFIACISSGFGGAIIGLGDVKQYLFGAGGLLGFLQVINPESGFNSSAIAAIVACAISFISAIIIMLFVGKDRLEIK